MSEFKVRWAELTDVAVITPLFDGYRQFYEKPSNLDFCQTFLQARLQAGESKIALAIDSTGMAVGFTQLYPLFSSLALSMDHARVWLLNDLFVVPAVRGFGVGEALMDYVQDFARETHIGYLMLETAKTNLPAQKLYEKQGWVRDHEFFVYSWHDTVLKKELIK